MDSSNKFNVRRYQARGSLAELIRFRVTLGNGAGTENIVNAEEAINLAAWLVGIADPGRKKFDRIWKEISDGA